MQFSGRKLLGTSLLVVTLAVTSFGGRPFLEAQRPAAVQTGNLADLMAATAQAASVDYFLKVDGIEGESTAKGHEGEIEVLSYSFGASNPASGSAGGGGGAGKATFQELHITSDISKASPKLFLACATGEHIREVVLTARKSGGGQIEFLKVKLTDVLVSSYQSSAGAGGDVPTDQFSLNFAKVEFTYVPQGADGKPGTPVTATFDVRTNSAE